MKTYEDMAREAEALRKAGTELNDLVPVPARFAKEVRAVFSVRLSPTELTAISKAAQERGQSVGDFIRLAAMAASRGELDVDLAARAQVMEEVRARLIMDLAEMLHSTGPKRAAPARSSARRHLWVVPREGRWAVRKEGNERVTSIHDTQDEAIAAARQVAMKQRSELIIQGEDGRIRGRSSYARDPSPSRG